MPKRGQLQSCPAARRPVSQRPVFPSQRRASPSSSPPADISILEITSRARGEFETHYKMIKARGREWLLRSTNHTSVSLPAAHIPSKRAPCPPPPLLPAGAGGAVPRPLPRPAPLSRHARVRPRFPVQPARPPRRPPGQVRGRHPTRQTPLRARRPAPPRAPLSAPAPPSILFPF